MVHRDRSTSRRSRAIASRKPPVAERGRIPTGAPEVRPVSSTGAGRCGRRGRAHEPSVRKYGEGIMMTDASSNTNAMSTSSEERRRTEAALVRALDMDPSVDAPETHAAVCQYVDLLADDGLLPETVVIAFKSAVSGAASLQRFEGDAREALRS